MASLGEHLAQALSVDPIILQADARRLRGEELRQMAEALKRRIATAVSGLAGRRTAGRPVEASRFRLVP